METLKSSESKSCEVSLGLSEVQLPQIPGIQKLVTDFCRPVAELVLRVNSPDSRFDPFSQEVQFSPFSVSPGKARFIVTLKNYHAKMLFQRKVARKSKSCKKKSEKMPSILWLTLVSGPDIDVRHEG